MTRSLMGHHEGYSNTRRWWYSKSCRATGAICPSVCCVCTRVRCSAGCCRCTCTCVGSVSARCEGTHRKMLVCVNTGVEQRKAGAVYVHMCAATRAVAVHGHMRGSVPAVPVYVHACGATKLILWYVHLYGQRQHWLCMYTRAGSASC